MGYIEETTRRVGLLKTALESESERGLILAGTAFLEDELKTLLQTFFEFERNPKEPGEDSDAFSKATKDLFGTDNPLSSFASKSNLAFVLGLIQDEHTSLDAIGRIRNRLAHKLEVDHLRHPEVAELMRRFVGSKKIDRTVTTSAILVLASKIVARTLILTDASFPTDAKRAYIKLSPLPQKQT